MPSQGFAFGGWVRRGPTKFTLREKKPLTEAELALKKAEGKVQACRKAFLEKPSAHFEKEQLRLANEAFSQAYMRLHGREPF